MKKKEISVIYLIPILFVLAVIPLLAFMTVYHSDIGENTWMSGSAFYDFFLFYKSRFLMVVAVVVALLFSFLLLNREYGNLDSRTSYLYLLPAGVFALFSFVSALASEHREDAIFGGYEQFEGLFVLLCYVLCFLMVYVFVSSERWVNLLVNTLLCGSLVLSLLGALQVMGWDYMTAKGLLPFFTMFVKNLPENFALKASFGQGVSYSTLYNPNYVGTYVALVLPVTVALGIWSKRRVFSFLAGASALCQLIMLFGAQSMTGLIGVAGAVLLAVVFLFSDIRKNRWILLGVGTSVIIAVLGIALFRPDLIKRFTQTSISSYDYTISSMETIGNGVDIRLDNGREVCLRMKDDPSIHQFELVDSHGKELELTCNENGEIYIKDSAYQGLLFYYDEKRFQQGETTRSYDVLRISTENGNSWDLVKIDGKIQYINGYNKLDQLRKVEASGFKHQYDLATNRGYLWSRTLPLLKETLLIGKGADNFVYAFPNDDYIGKVSCGYDSQIVTKPHNMYMQIWVQDGMPACLAFLVLFGIFAVLTFRHCFTKGKLSYLQKIQIGLLCGTAGYMIAGLANDATICVTPIFWVLLGLGYGIDHMNLKKVQ